MSLDVCGKIKKTTTRHTKKTINLLRIFFRSLMMRMTHILMWTQQVFSNGDIKPELREWNKLRKKKRNLRKVIRSKSKSAFLDLQN